MILLRALYLIAVAIYIMSGAGHLIGHFIILADLEGSLAYITMDMVEVSLFFMKRTVLQFLNGFSITMGVLMLGIGFFNLINFLQFQNNVLTSPILSFYNFLLALAITLISIAYFTWTPIFMFTFVCLVFLFMFIRSLVKK